MIVKEQLISEISDFVMNSSDADNLIVSIFIAGMQAKGNYLLDIGSKETEDSSKAAERGNKHPYIK